MNCFSLCKGRKRKKQIINGENRNKYKAKIKKYQVGLRRNKLYSYCIYIYQADQLRIDLNKYHKNNIYVCIYTYVISINIYIFFLIVTYMYLCIYHV